MSTQPPRRRPSTTRSARAGAKRVSAPEVEQSSSRGASSHHTAMGDRWQAYLSHHRHSAKDSLQRLMAKPLQSLLTWLVLAVALALPAILLVSMNNLQSLGQRWDGAPQMSVFINPRAQKAAIESIQRRIKQREGIQRVEYISPKQALSDFESQSSLGSALRSLEANPLPPALVITPMPELSAEALAALGAELEAMPAVDEVLFDQAWVQRLHEVLRLGEVISLSLGALLALGVILVIGNTVRLAIESRREEIVIIKLVGGTNAFVRRPFLYTGLWYGGGGGLLALLLLVSGLQWIASPVASLAALYGSDFTLQGLGFTGGVLLISLASLIGWLGAWLAVGRHLGEIEPQ